MSKDYKQKFQNFTNSEDLVFIFDEIKMGDPNKNNKIHCKGIACLILPKCIFSDLWRDWQYQKITFLQDAPDEFLSWDFTWKDHRNEGKFLKIYDKIFELFEKYPLNYRHSFIDWATWNAYPNNNQKDEDILSKRMNYFLKSINRISCSSLEFLEYIRIQNIFFITDLKPETKFYIKDIESQQMIKIDKIPKDISKIIKKWNNNYINNQNIGTNRFLDNKNFYLISENNSGLNQITDLLMHLYINNFQNSSKKYQEILKKFNFLGRKDLIPHANA